VEIASFMEKAASRRPWRTGHSAGTLFDDRSVDQM
jgi:hypothetical protein